MIKPNHYKSTNIIMKDHRTLRVRVRVRFILFYFELAPIDPPCNMLQTLPARKKYEEEMSDEEPPTTPKVLILVFFESHSALRNFSLY